MAEEVENAIRESIQGPASAEADGVKVTRHPLPHVIEADKHLGRREAGRNPARAFARVKIVPPGTA